MIRRVLRAIAALFVAVLAALFGCVGMIVLGLDHGWDEFSARWRSGQAEPMGYLVLIVAAMIATGSTGTLPADWPHRRVATPLVALGLWLAGTTVFAIYRGDAHYFSPWMYGGSAVVLTLAGLALLISGGARPAESTRKST